MERPTDRVLIDVKAMQIKCKIGRHAKRRAKIVVGLELPRAKSKKSSGRELPRVKSENSSGQESPGVKAEAPIRKLQENLEVARLKCRTDGLKKVKIMNLSCRLVVVAS